MESLYWTLWISLFLGICYGITVPTIKLLDGNEMPIVGFGTYNLNPKQVETSMLTAIKVGYKHFDTAFFTEKEVGKTIQKWFAKGGKREDLYIATKLSPQDNRPSDIAKAMEISLKNLGVKYVDLYMILVPYSLQRTPDHDLLKYENGTYALDMTTDHIAIWKEMEKLVRTGKTKSIGLSNFNKTQILRIWNNAEIKPASLEIEINPYIQQEELRELCKELGMALTAYSPLGSGDTIHMRRKRETVVLPSVINNPVIVKIAKKHNKTPAQIALRYTVQRNIAIIPKSSNPKRIKENIDIFDFALTNNEMNEIKKLDQHGRYRKFDFLSYNAEHHPEYPFADRIPA